MRKAIVKCKLKNRDEFEKKLADIDLDFSTVYWQHDRIYVPRNYKPHANFPRLIMRTEMHAVDKPAKYSFILKRHIEDSGIDIVEETVIKDYEIMVNVILQLGFKPIAEVSRRRQDLKMGEGNFIYLDKVEKKSGYFAKIESEITATDSIQEAKEDLKKTFETLGENNFVESTYFELN
ncbi:CYTH domain-containing protein [Candidatus Saccharibacteria bacterium]|nr:CYTH domain-containing protein [Candidatus Saccharibacteria bacterium]MBR3122005.1 CYTH domain-containing protein [Candidatus Saccharibacteria bacterium]